MVTTSYPRYEGDHAGHFVESLAGRLVGLGHAVTVIAPHERALPRTEMIGRVRVERFAYLPGWAEQVAYGSGIVPNLKTRPMAVLGLLPFIVALRRRVRLLARDCDLVHIHWAPTAALAAPWRLSTPYVVTLHGSDVTLATRGGLWRTMLKRALTRAAGVDVVAEAQRRFLEECGLWDARRPLVVLPAGVDEELAARVRPSRNAERVRFLFVGRLVEEKGVLDLMDAFASISPYDPDVELSFVGSGPLSSRLEDMAASAGAADRVRLEGALTHEQALDAISAADVLVLPSHGEGSPLVVAEALALGTPVIGSAVGAMPELLGDEGLLVEPGDREGLARAMHRLAADAHLRQQLSDEGRVRASARLLWSGIAESTVEFYSSVLCPSGVNVRGSV